MGRLFVRLGFPVQKLHALRHGFASWNLVRYFMLTDRNLLQDVRHGRFEPGLDGRHAWFGDASLADFAEVIGGANGRHAFDSGQGIVPSATDLAMLSKLLGHANRFTTLENYTNSIGWISHYYLRKHEAEILGGRRARRSYGRRG